MTSPPPDRLRFSVDDYYRLAEVGILQPDDRVELLDGEVIRMSPVGSRHAACVDRLVAVLHAALSSLRPGDRPIVRCQSPIRLDERSEPEPDVTLLRARDDFYAASHPGPADVLLVVEVADSSLGFDRDVKLPRYAAAKIPEVWIVDLAESTIDIHRCPAIVDDPPRFTERSRHGRGETLRPLAIPNLEIEVDHFL